MRESENRIIENSLSAEEEALEYVNTLVIVTLFPVKGVAFIKMA
jgi:hypothetical protein